MIMPKYSTWHGFSCLNPSSCDCHSLHASKCWHWEMAAASNNAFLSQKDYFQSSALQSVMLHFTPPRWRWGQCDSCLSYDAGKGIVGAGHSDFNLCLLLLDKDKSTVMISSFGSTSSSQILFLCFSCRAFFKLAPSLLAPTRTGANLHRALANCVSHERCGLPICQKIWRCWMWGCITGSRNKSCKHRKMPLFPN